MEQEIKAAVERLTEFLGSCGNADIEAGIGQIYGFGSKESVEAFETGIAAAIRGKSE